MSAGVFALLLDRIDSVSFAAPVFFHLTRYFFSLK
jgi:predicted CDP-diglyceride synthetase/phosphatidate cytidylyltransferase